MISYKQKHDGEDFIKTYLGEQGVSLADYGIRTLFLHTIQSIGVGKNANGNSAIAFNYDTIHGVNAGQVFFFDNSDNSWKVDMTTAEEGYKIFHEGHLPPLKLQAPDGTWYELEVDNSGALSAVAV